MKNLVVFLVIAVMSFFAVSCDKGNEVTPEPENEWSVCQVVIFFDNPEASSAIFTLHSNPIIQNLEEKRLNREENMFEYLFDLELDTFEGQLVKLDIMVAYGDDTPRYEDSKTFIVKDDDEKQIIEFSAP